MNKTSHAEQLRRGIADAHEELGATVSEFAAKTHLKERSQAGVGRLRRHWRPTAALSTAAAALLTIVAWRRRKAAHQR